MTVAVLLDSFVAASVKIEDERAAAAATNSAIGLGGTEWTGLGGGG